MVQIVRRAYRESQDSVQKESEDPERLKREFRKSGEDRGKFRVGPPRVRKGSIES